MKEDFVDFNLAVKLKEKGYPQKSFGKYSMAGACYFNDGRFYEDGCIANVEDCCSAPTISQVLKWLRNEYNILVSPSVYGDEDGRKWNYAIVNIETFELLNPVLTSNLASFEEAALSGIEYVLDNLI